MPDYITKWFNSISKLIWLNGWTLLGSSLTTISTCVIFFFIVLNFFGSTFSPYIGILVYLLLPGLFLIGLGLVLLGVLLRGRKVCGKEAKTKALPSIDFNSPRVRRMTILIAMLSLFNFMLVSAMAYKGTVYMETTEFCGMVCHTVMAPEFTAHLDSPHSEVKCVECHIGSGLPSFMHAKANGLRQVLGVLTGDYARPIAAPVHGMRESKFTCGECHDSEKNIGKPLRITTDYSPDDTNLPMKSVLTMFVGGGDAEGPGIHTWHVNHDHETYYYSPDEKREKITYVRVDHSDGTQIEYFAEENAPDPATLPEGALRKMDCIDCHNRPTHEFFMPGPALNQAMDAGRIDPALPYIKLAAQEALEASVEIPEGEEAPDGAGFVEAYIRNYYQENQPELVSDQSDAIDQAIKETQAIYNRNIYPEMNISWGTYPNHNGHTQFDGCFRCHDDMHVSKDGEKIITQDCTICHNVLAWQEEEPEILTLLNGE